MLLWLLAFVCARFALAQLNGDCADAPNSATRRTCVSLRRMDTMARRNNARAQSMWAEEAMPPGSPTWQQPLPVPFTSRGQVATHPYECMTLQCLCPFFRVSSGDNRRLDI